MYHKIVAPVGAVAAGGGIIGQSLWLVVAGGTLVAAGLALMSLMPKRRAH